MPGYTRIISHGAFPARSSAASGSGGGGTFGSSLFQLGGALKRNQALELLQFGISEKSV
jgi:hypothetical protein